MSEALGAIHLLCGLVLLALAVMIPPRATTTSGGLTIAALFLAAALERFWYGYHRLVENDLRTDSVAAGGLVWASLVLIILGAATVITWRIPERDPKAKRPGD